MELLDLGEGGLELLEAGSQGSLQFYHAHPRLYPSSQLSEVEGFGDVVVGAGLQARDRILPTIVRREQDEIPGRARPQRLANLAANVRAVQTGHHPVENRQRRPVVLLELVECVSSIRTDDDLPSGNRLRMARSLPREA